MLCHSYLSKKLIHKPPKKFYSNHSDIFLISTLGCVQVDRKKKEKKDKERENEKEKSALTKERVQKRRQTTSPSTTIQRSRPEARYWFWFPLVWEWEPELRPPSWEQLHVWQMVQGAVIYLLIEPLLDTAAVPEAQSGAGGGTVGRGFPAIGFRPRLPNKNIKKFPKRMWDQLASLVQTALNVARWETSPHLLHRLLPCSTPKLKNRPPSPAAPKSRPLSPLVPAASSKTPTGKKTPPPPTSGAKTRPKRAQTPARVQPQAVAAVSVEKDLDLQQSASTEEKKGECPSPSVVLWLLLCSLLQQ